MTNGAMKKLYKFYAFLVYLVPMLALLIIRREHYASPEKAIGIFGIMIIFFVVLYFQKQLFSMKGKAFIIISGLLFVFSIITRFIAEELEIITGVSFVAAVISEFINIVANVYEDYEYKMIDGVKRKNTERAITQKQAWREAYGIWGE